MTNKMPKIKGFHNSLYHIRGNTKFQETMTFVPKVKMHGTNAGIRIDLDGTITAQKRTADIFVGEDNMAFAHFVENEIKPNIDLHRVAMNLFWPKGCDGPVTTEDKSETANVTIMGEWVGPGVQRGVAISEIEEKVFMPFAVFVNSKRFNGQHIVHYDGWSWGVLAAEMEKACERVLFLHPLFSQRVEINPHNQDELHAAVDTMNADVLAIEEECPVSSELFGVKGIGEGLVYYPTELGTANQNYCHKHELELFGFKVKGEKHATNKAGKPARVRSKIPDSAFEFAAFHCTEARLQQGLGEVLKPGERLDTKHIGKLIGWVCKDISVECETEIVESGLDWKKQLSGVIATEVRKWTFQQLENQSLAVAAE
ncbi:MAG: RNA ligase family protein [Hyphomonas sp.]|nr:RNA ligase family protein [Hyphomonas sp.]